ncbi:RhuM family protein [Methylobacterium sp. SI9]|uniref:RhuM family protein n=1 Tax=Methylobacterium guangdongense TaxID=3138811 RepID=UPI00313B3DD0
MSADDDKRPGILRRAGQKVADLARKVVKETAQLDFFARFKPSDAGQEIDFPIDVGHDTIWATQHQMAALFGVDQSVVARHIKNIFDNNELDESEATHAKIALVQSEGSRQVTRQISHYSLDVIFTVGYRVNGTKAGEFRRWANGVLRGYVEEGYALNGARLRSDPGALQRLVEEVRSIRTSEKHMWQKVRDTFVACAIDYDPKSEDARKFFYYSQDAFHYAVTEATAAQIIMSRADGTKTNMGMTALGNKEPTLTDAQIAKNYMTSEELRSLELLGEAWLIYAEGITHRGMQVSMARLLSKINELIVVNEYSSFPGYSGVSCNRTQANEHAKRQLEIYRTTSLPHRKRTA